MVSVHCDPPGGETGLAWLVCIRSRQGSSELTVLIRFEPARTRRGREIGPSETLFPLIERMDARMSLLMAPVHDYP